MYIFVSPLKVQVHIPNHFLQDCHNPASAFDAAAIASLLFTVLALEVRLTDLALEAIMPLAMLDADLQANLPETQCGRGLQGTFARGTISQLRIIKL